MTNGLLEKKLRREKQCTMHVYVNISKKTTGIFWTGDKMHSLGLLSSRHGRAQSMAKHGILR